MNPKNSLKSLVTEKIKSSLTPQAAYALFNSPNSFLLESGKDGRYSYIGYDPFLVIQGKNSTTWVNGKSTQRPALEVLHSYLKKYHRPAPRQKGLPPFVGGAAGYFSYDLGRQFERLPKKAVDDLKTPDLYFVFVDKVIVFDHEQNEIILVGLGADKHDASRKIREIKSRLGNVHGPEFTLHPSPFAQRPAHITSNFTKSGYLRAIKEIHHAIRDGETYQVNLSQRFETKVHEDLWNIYLRLMKINPSPYSAFLNFNEIQIASCSPERFIKLTGRDLETKPIKGTRPRGKNVHEDKQLKKDLLNSIKENAEHMMIVDLERNDLGRIAEFGSVKVTKLRAVERYSHVQHLVSTIHANLKKGLDWQDVLRAMFPGGSVTGCPKIRTTEIIEQLEPVRRGIYTGSIGYISFSGDMDLNIAIRTFVQKGQKLYIQVGGGIVQDSEAEQEYQETLHKAQALIEAIR